MKQLQRMAVGFFLAALFAQFALAAPNPENKVYFGAVHVHTNYSCDAFTNGTLTTPANAYQWAMGEAIPGGGGGPDLQLKTPLDFYAVSDHAEWMGVFKEMANPRSPLSEHPLADSITSSNANTRMQAFAGALRSFSAGERDETLSNPQLSASDGLMFSLTTFDGEPLSEADIDTRKRNEPLYEITQVKRSSETHPELSPNDEFAGFEIWDYTLSADSRRPGHRRGSYARQALLDGLSFSADGKGNPFHYGFIGDTDTHNAGASHEEFNYSGKFAFKNEPKHRLFGIPGQPDAQKQQVLEIPTPRWSTRDATALGVDIPGGLAETIQERAYSSPIWYSPTR